MDYATQQQILLRQRRLADLLRAQSEAEAPYTPNEGRMISGRYVGPSWAQNLANFAGPLVNRNRTAQAEALAAQQEAAYGAALANARQGWQNSAPAITPGTPELAGPQAQGGSPELAATPAQFPSRSAILRHTMAGLDIPGNERAATLWNAGMGQELDREDKQQEMSMLQRERIAEARRAQLERLEQQAAQLKLKLEQQERENVRDNETRRMHQQTLALIASMRAAEKSGPSAVDLREQQREVVKLSTRMKEITPVVDAAQQVQDLLDTYTDPKTGKIKDIPGLGYIGALPGWARSAGSQVGLVDPATNPNRAILERLVGNIMRNQAGLSQTISEQARVLQTMLSSGSYSQKEFTDAWGSFVRNLDAELANIKAGHTPAVVDTYLERGGRIEGPKSRSAGTVQEPTVVDKKARLEELRRKAAGG